MKLHFHDNAWEDYQWWQAQRQAATLRKIHRMIDEASRDPETGIGKPERLRHYEGFWSRRITHEHRMVYTIVDGALVIIQLRNHYS